MAKLALKIAFLFLIIQLPAVEGKTYLTKKDFLSEVFVDVSPEKKTLWLTNEIQEKLSSILDHR